MSNSRKSQAIILLKPVVYSKLDRIGLGENPENIRLMFRPLMIFY